MDWVIIIGFVIIVLELGRRNYIKKNPTHKVTWWHLFRYLSKFIVPIALLGAFVAGLLGYTSSDNFLWFTVALLCFGFVWLSYENEHLEMRINNLEQLQKEL